MPNRKNNVQRVAHPLTRKLLRDAEFCRDAKRRVDAAQQIVERLPRTTRDIELLLSATPHALSREVQYSLLNMLDFTTLRLAHVKRLLPAVLSLLYNIKSPTAFLWMKSGCLLGDGFLNSADSVTRQRIVSELLLVLRTAKSRHARKGALHGVEHALDTATVREGKQMLDAVRQVATEDRSIALRRTAFRLLRDGRWWGNGGLPALHQYARGLGKSLRVNDYY
jgi:hypothetical protein